jgi:recombinational DNA repair protein RecT
MGECYFIPYYNKSINKPEVQLQIGYKGWRKLARQSGLINDIYAECIYAGDKFELVYGLKRDLIHLPNWDADRSDKNIQFAYAVCIFKDGYSTFTILPKKEIERLRLKNAMQQAIPTGTWKDDYYGMAQAKAIKKLAKSLPQSIDINVNNFQTAAQIDGSVIDFRSLQSNGQGLRIEDLENNEDDIIEKPLEQIKESNVQSNPIIVTGISFEHNSESQTTPIFSTIPESEETLIARKTKNKKANEKIPEKEIKPQNEISLTDILKEKGFIFDDSDDNLKEHCWRGGPVNHWLDIYLNYNEDNTILVNVGTDDEKDTCIIDRQTESQVIELVNRWDTGEILKSI